MIGFFVGNGSLLLRCAEEFIDVGGRIAGISSEDPRILDWARSHEFHLAGPPDAPAYADIEYDYLFSVANLSLLPEAAIAKAGRLALNFHDGPLPAYAGLNAPVWAMLAGETLHAITWHEMTARTDGGRIARVRQFPISTEDTALTLNAKCFDAGLEAFREIVRDLGAGTVTLTEQTGPRGWYGKARRPESLGALDLRTPAAEVARVVRALDHGPYDNPLVSAKLWLGTTWAVIGAADVCAETPTGLPGTVVEVGTDTLRVSARDADLVFSGLRDVTGAPLSDAVLAELRGSVLSPVPAFSDESRKAMGAAESDWRAALLDSRGFASPYRLERTAELHALSADVASEGAEPDALVAAFAAWLALQGCQDRITLSMFGPPAHPLCAALRPATFDVDPRASAASHSDQAEETIAAVRGAAPMAADLPGRISDQAARAAALDALSVGVAQGNGSTADQLAGRDLVLSLSPSRLIARAGYVAQETLDVMAANFAAFLASFFERPDAPLALLPLGAPMPDTFARQDDAFASRTTVSETFTQKVAACPEAVALVADGVGLSYAELDARAERLARALAEKGAAPGRVVGICLPRCEDLIVAMLAVLRTGAAYLPLDPQYPADRVSFMIGNSEAALVISKPEIAARLEIDGTKVVLPDEAGTIPLAESAKAEDLAYLIYTSGSTGQPKGVMITHRNVQNFFAGMDEAVPLDEGARVLASTSVSFDISVLEILWTLTRGRTVVLRTDGAIAAERPAFSLFYFASQGSAVEGDGYRLLREGARFADANGFEAIWTPERHFHAFGGLYPNPAISSAMVAGMTENVKVRAGSCVLPLHHPVRAAEDWAFVDNLSQGRAGMAIASGWQPVDFVMRPDAFADRKTRLFDALDQLRALWRGESVTLPDPEGRPTDVALPFRPRRGEVPVWVTAAGNPETFAEAGRRGCGLLTHLLGQTVEEVAQKIGTYRAAWKEAGHPGEGTVTLMLHTFVGEDEHEVRETVRGPMKGYLKSAVDLVRRASWSFPTFVEQAKGAGLTPQEVFDKRDLTPEEEEALLDHAFERYYRTSGLFGTPSDCADFAREVAAIGVDEIACLIDFGVEAEAVLRNLPMIRRVMDELETTGTVGRQATVAEVILGEQVSHVQCTPSLARLLVADDAGRKALERLDVLMVGGEALPQDLAATLRARTQGAVLNMYGPTEATVWSSTSKIDAADATVSLGRPIVNTVLSIRAVNGRELPPGAAGELWIGGEGIARGYWKRPELTAERFLETAGGRFYRTGDLVRLDPDGQLEFLGRLDAQVKIRGHRIELGDVEAALRALDGVEEGAVIAPVAETGDASLLAYATAAPGRNLSGRALRDMLAERLPEFMVPSRVILLPSMPMTPNGKIDRKALPAPSPETAAAGDETGSNTERAITEIWKSVLGVDQVGLTDNFFDVGGHSLLVIQVQRRMAEHFGRETAITDMFRFTTIAALAAHIDGGGAPGGQDATTRGTARALARRRRMASR